MFAISTYLGPLRWRLGVYSFLALFVFRGTGTSTVIRGKASQEEFRIFFFDIRRYRVHVQFEISLPFIKYSSQSWCHWWNHQIQIHDGKTLEEVKTRRVEASINTWKSTRIDFKHVSSALDLSRSLGNNRNASEEHCCSWEKATRITNDHLFDDSDTTIITTTNTKYSQLRL